MPPIIGRDCRLTPPNNESTLPAIIGRACRLKITRITHGLCTIFQNCCAAIVSRGGQKSSRTLPDFPKESPRQVPQNASRITQISRQAPGQPGSRGARLLGAEACAIPPRTTKHSSKTFSSNPRNHTQTFHDFPRLSPNHDSTK